MKSNQELGFTEIGSGEGDAGSSETADLTVGSREGAGYRAYCTIYHSEQDASRNGVVDELSARSDTPGVAMGILAERAADQWSEKRARGVRRAIIEAEDEIAESQA